ncbi:hypothetical protein BDU57DRAFT_532926 [Ampelomyces quisqualis]|uniref:Uncharacterized protein n=1 Tax=Ampelomyces quisqualis TaxID=50730 RepID=A0A6A5Q998_AMPQU|nr:hypothetical protein BDU57DRAFT_532926 [Ampelomyces quisqualis]
MAPSTHAHNVTTRRRCSSTISKLVELGLLAALHHENTTPNIRSSSSPCHLSPSRRIREETRTASTVVTRVGTTKRGRTDEDDSAVSNSTSPKRVCIDRVTEPKKRRSKANIPYWPRQVADSAETAALLRRARRDYEPFLGTKTPCRGPRVRTSVMPDGDLAPDGTETVRLVPCGCLYEMKGMWIDSEWERKAYRQEGKKAHQARWIQPRSFGHHKLVFMSMFKLLFGYFTTEILLNTNGARLAAVDNICQHENRFNTRMGMSRS